MLIAAIFGIIAAACGGGTTDTAATTSDAIAAQAQGDAPAAGVFDGSFIDLNGETVDFASYEGQDVVLWYWAPW